MILLWATLLHRSVVERVAIQIMTTLLVQRPKYMVWTHNASPHQPGVEDHKGILGEAGQLDHAATTGVQILAAAMTEGLALNPATIAAHGATNVAHGATIAARVQTVATIVVRDQNIVMTAEPGQTSAIAADPVVARSNDLLSHLVGGLDTMIGADSMLSRQRGESAPLQTP
jgi:hypothetical protein